MLQYVVFCVSISVCPWFYIENTLIGLVYCFSEFGCGGLISGGREA